MGYPNADITFPKADKDSLIYVASSNLNPFDYDFLFLSLPAKSTNATFEHIILSYTYFFI